MIFRPSLKGRREKGETSTKTSTATNCDPGARTRIMPARRTDDAVFRFRDASGSSSVRLSDHRPVFGVARAAHFNTMLAIAMGRGSRQSNAKSRGLSIPNVETAIRHGGHVNSRYDNATGRFDFVPANPPFNVNAVDTAMRASAKSTQTKPDRRSVGETELDYFWIQLFPSALNDKGRAAFVMATSATDARLVESGS